jgi:hypothetical protein
MAVATSTTATLGADAYYMINGSIPSTYDRIHTRHNIRLTSGSHSYGWYPWMYLNYDYTGANYNMNYFYGTGGVAGVVGNYNGSGMFLYGVPDTYQNANVWGVIDMWFLNPSDTTFQKAITWRSGFINYSTTAGYHWLSTGTALWESTAAITSQYLYSGSTSAPLFAAGSSMTMTGYDLSG